VVKAGVVVARSGAPARFASPVPVVAARRHKRIRKGIEYSDDEGMSSSNRLQGAPGNGSRPTEKAARPRPRRRWRPPRPFMPSPAPNAMVGERCRAVAKTRCAAVCQRAFAYVRLR